MKRVYTIATAVTLLTVLLGSILQITYTQRKTRAKLKVGFVYISDQSAAYTDNFMRLTSSLKDTYGDQISIYSRNNVPEHEAANTFKDLKKHGCKLIFATSYTYKKQAKIFAKNNPDIEVCAATADNANNNPVLPNYHTFMGTIYEGRYLTGVAAGMKLSELISQHKATTENARIGYVAAMSTPEVISGYTAFFLGIRSIVPSATMRVCYTGKWADYPTEMRMTDHLIDEGCIIIGQHTDTIAPAISCEQAAAMGRNVYHVGYNSNMMDVAPTSSITSCIINWEPYITQAIEACLKGCDIESVVKAQKNHNDSWAGLDKDWVQINTINPIVAASHTKETLETVKKKLIHGKCKVFQGNYTGIDPKDPSDTYDLRNGYEENHDASTPQFHYVLSDVITIEDN